MNGVTRYLPSVNAHAGPQLRQIALVSTGLVADDVERGSFEVANLFEI